MLDYIKSIVKSRVYDYVTSTIYANFTRSSHRSTTEVYRDIAKHLFPTRVVFTKNDTFSLDRIVRQFAGREVFLTRKHRNGLVHLDVTERPCLLNEICVAIKITGSSFYIFEHFHVKFTVSGICLSSHST